MTDISKADVAIARIEKATGPLRAEQKQFLIDHEVEYSRKTCFLTFPSGVIAMKLLTG